MVDVKNEQTKPSGYFSLANIVDNILNNESKKSTNSEQSQNREEFISITSKFNQGNAISAYQEYDKLIDKTDNDLVLLKLSKVFYNIGFFSLARKSTKKITDKNKYSPSILDLERSYEPKIPLIKDDEIYFAKAYSSIFFDNSASEALIELANQKKKYKNNDYYNYLLSCANSNVKKYSRALRAINKAIKINPSNINYKIAKVDILIASGKYNSALSLIKKLESENIIEFKSELETRNEQALSGACKNEKEKKYHAIKIGFLEGNFEKTKKDCLTVLNFDKNNDKIISLYAKAELATGNVEKAAKSFENAYKINKKNIDNLIGLGDIYYIKKDYFNSIKMYKKALKKEQNNPEILIKLATSQREFANVPDDLEITEQLVDKYCQKDFLAYYNSAISIAQKNTVLKESFLKRSMDISPLYKNTMGELIALNLKNKNYKTAAGLIDVTSFTLEKNYYYYYLCGLYSESINKKQDAIQFYKTSLDLNPDFEAANVRLLNLVSTGEEM